MNIAPGASNQSINQISIAPIPPGEIRLGGATAKSVFTATLMQQFCDINGLSGVPVSKRESISQRYVSSDVS